MNGGLKGQCGSETVQTQPCGRQCSFEPTGQKHHVLEAEPSVTAVQPVRFKPRPPSCDQQPKHDDQSHEQEEAGQELLVHVLWRPRGSWGGTAVVDIKGCGKNPKGKGTDSKGHLETSVPKTESLKTTPVFWLRSLSLWSGRCPFSGVLLTGASTPI